jgi:hypothetical protein
MSASALVLLPLLLPLVRQLHIQIAAAVSHSLVDNDIGIDGCFWASAPSGQAAKAARHKISVHERLWQPV